MSDRLLPDVVVLRCDHDPTHPVWDLERLCRVVLDGHVRATSTRLELSDYDEALGFMLGEAYVLTPRYCRGRGSVPFAAWIQGQLGFRLRDHLRAPYGKRAESRIGQGRFAELDRQGADGDGHPLDAALPEGEGARLDDWGEALGGHDAQGDRDVLREVARLGLRTRRRAAGRAGAGVAADRELTAGPFRDCAACGWRNYPQAPNGRPGWHVAGCGGCGAILLEGEAA